MVTKKQKRITMTMLTIIIIILFIAAISLMVWDIMSEQESFKKGYWCGYFLSTAVILLMYTLKGIL